MDLMMETIPTELEMVRARQWVLEGNYHRFEDTGLSQICHFLPSGIKLPVYVVSIDQSP